VRILLWHGWLLEGSGSNVATARVAEVFRDAGHDVLLLCQERHPERFDWIDAHGTIGSEEPRALAANPGARSASGRCVLMRPEIGPVLPVFVLDPYEGFDDVRRFVDLEHDVLEAYLHRNVEAVRTAAAWHRPDVAIVGHAIPGAAIGGRALGPGRYVTKVHGSDLEYAIRLQPRYRDLASEGLLTAHAVVGPTADVLDRCARLVPGIQPLGRVVPPGVDVHAFRPMPRAEALADVAQRLDADPDTSRGRPTSLDRDVERALDDRDLDALDGLAARYDHDVPDTDAAARLRGLVEAPEPIVGYLGKLIPEKGVELLVQALARLRHDARGLVVGFGSGRDRLAALVLAIERGDVDAQAWLREVAGMPVEPAPPASRSDLRVTFTGRLDHRYAPGALAAMDVSVVPSVLGEAFGMVAAEAASGGSLPLVARHSGLAEIADALEEEGVPAAFETDNVDDLVEKLESLLGRSESDREELRRRARRVVEQRWSWASVAGRLLEPFT
jgi:glycosyltransferase involved in cell wall biosynthesis